MPYKKTPELREAKRALDQGVFDYEPLYFEETPEELIGLDKNHYVIRYYYNPKISKNLLNGLSPELTDSIKIRIFLKVQMMFYDFQTEEEKDQTHRMLMWELNRRVGP